MSCRNCFNGCSDPTSDKCIKYTGINIPQLNIQTGDTLLHVENQIVATILNIITGEGIIPTLDEGEICSLVESYLPVSGDITLNDVISALILSICDIQGRLLSVESTLNTLNSNYDVGCLSGVVASDDTHDILQATILKLCAVDSALTALALDLSTNYVLISEIDTYIQNYIDSLPTSNLISNKLVPYVAVAYFGPTLGVFDITGAGIGIWDRVFLCNGQNFTPDLRGRALVGTTTMGSTPFNPAVDPGIPGNPTYSLNTTLGANVVALTAAQNAAHTHVVTIDPTTSLTGSIQHVSQSFNDFGSATGVFTKISGFTDSESPADTDSQNTGSFSMNVNHTHTNTVSSSGAGDPHNNIQPVLAANFIMYIPL